MVEEVLLEAARKGRAAQRAGTYRDGAGLLRCSVCHEPREMEIPGFSGLLPVTCSCIQHAEAEKEARRREEEARARARKSPFWTPGYGGMTFEADDNPDSEASRRCRRYVRLWREAAGENLGLLFSGPLGTGKSFYAAAVVNALTALGVPGVMVSTARLVNLARASREPQGILDDLNRFPLVALDDLGAERDTDFALEVLESFVDARCLVSRPLLVTTNLSGKQLRNPADLRYARLFDRVLALCPYPVLLTGASRRVKQEEARRNRLRELLDSPEEQPG